MMHRTLRFAILVLALLLLPSLAEALPVVYELDLDNPVVSRTVEANVEFGVQVVSIPAGWTCTYKIDQGPVKIPALKHSLRTAPASLNLGRFTLVPGEELEVQVECKQGNETKSWTFVLTTGPRGEWRTTYGFTFALDDDEEFFLEQGEGEDDASTFTIRPERDADSGDLVFAPSVLYQWISRKQQLKDWANGPVAGFGFDLEKPILFAGWGWTNNSNVTYTLGLLIHNQKRLAGEYEVGQELEENLQADKLVDDVYRPNLYLGIGFRFDANPLKPKKKAE